MTLDLKKLFPNSKFPTAEELKAKEDSFSIGDRVKVADNIRCIQHGKTGTIVRIEPEDKHGWKSFIVKFDDEKYGAMGFQSGNIDKINEKETAMKKINENTKITLTIGQLKSLIAESIDSIKDIGDARKPSEVIKTERDYNLSLEDRSQYLSFAYGSSGYQAGKMNNGKWCMIYWDKYKSSVKIPKELDMWFDRVQRIDDNHWLCLRGNKINVWQWPDDTGFMSKKWEPADKDFVNELKNKFIHTTGRLTWHSKSFDYAFVIRAKKSPLIFSRYYGFVDNDKALELAGNDSAYETELEKCKKMNKTQVEQWIKNGGKCAYVFGLWNNTYKPISKEKALQLLPKFNFGGEYNMAKLTWGRDGNDIVLQFKELGQNDMFESKHF